MSEHTFILHSMSLSMDNVNKRVLITAVGEIETPEGEENVPTTLQSPEIQGSFERHLYDIITASNFNGDVTQANLKACAMVFDELKKGED